MTLNRNSEQFPIDVAVNVVQPGPELIAYMQENYKWQFSKITDTKPLPQPNEELTDYWRRITEQLDRLKRQYEDAYFINDGFEGNHSERRQFYRSLGKSGSWLKQHSKLSGNNWSGCLYTIAEVLRFLQRKNITIPFSIDQIDLITAKQHEYHEMPFDEKVAFVTEIDQIVYNFFEALSQAQLKDTTEQ